MTSDVSAKGESECEATSLDFVILDYCIMFKMNLNIENVLEKQEISKNKQSRQTHTNKFPLFFISLFQVGSGNESVGCCQVLFCFCKFALLTAESQC